MGSESPLAPKPKSAVPSYLLSGTSQSSPSRKRERENLTSSIKSTYGRRLLAVPEDAQEGPSVKRPKEHGTSEGETLLRQPARDPRDEAPITPTSRPASPYTLQPPIDYDGLSWPSMFRSL
jgi:GTP cyclohydrolase IA